LQLEGNAVLEYLPQESIVFDGANAYSHCDINIGEYSKLAIWDILCLGCPASRSIFEQGEYRSDWRVSVAGKTLWRERAQLRGGSELLQSPVGLRGRTVMGTMLLSTPHTREPDNEVLKSSLLGLRAIDTADIDAQLLAGVTALPCGLVLRVLAHEAEQARAYFTACWKLLRPVLMGREALVPRIWHT
jgi:urease accessory protein